jgi:hypothetical protein
VCSNAAYALKSWMTSIAAWQISEVMIKLMVKNTVRGERDVPIEQPGEIEGMIVQVRGKSLSMTRCGRGFTPIPITNFDNGNPLDPDHWTKLQ